METITAFFAAYTPLVCVIRIILAGVSGGIIGAERTLRQKDAGFRTHIIVAMGSALMMVISKYGFFDIVEREGVSADVSRIAANIITGISFLGAGMIFVKGFSIKGLTTAAGIWVTSAVGMAIGAGMYMVGFVSVVMLLLVQIIFHRFLIGFDKVLANDTLTPCFIQLENDHAAVEGMKAYMRAHGVNIADSTVDVSADNSLLTVRMNVQFAKKVDIDNVMKEYLKTDGVKQAFAL